MFVLRNSIDSHQMYDTEALRLEGSPTVHLFYMIKEMIEQQSIQNSPGRDYLHMALTVIKFHKPNTLSLLRKCKSG